MRGTRLRPDEVIRAAYGEHLRRYREASDPVERTRLLTCIRFLERVYELD